MLTTKFTTTETPSYSEPDQQPLLLSVRQAARLMGVGTTLCWELVNSGQLPSVRLGRRVLIPRAAVERLAHTSEVS